MDTFHCSFAWADTFAWGYSAKGFFRLFKCSSYTITKNIILRTDLWGTKNGSTKASFWKKEIFVTDPLKLINLT